MPYDADQIANLDAALDALDAPTTAEVLAVTDNYDGFVVAASAARRALGAGGGSQTRTYTFTAAEIAARWDAGLGVAYVELGPFAIGDIVEGAFCSENSLDAGVPGTLYFLAPGLSTVAVDAGVDVGFNIFALDQVGAVVTAYTAALNVVTVQAAASGYLGIDSLPTTGSLTLIVMVA